MKIGLFAFILLSALVHAVIIGIENDWIFAIQDNHEQGSSSLNIELSTYSKSPEKISSLNPQQNSIPVQQPSSSSAQSDAEIKKENIADEKADQLSSVKPEKIHENKTASSDIKNKKSDDKKITKPAANKKSKLNHNEDIKSLLNSELSKHFYYPKAARRKNRQGSVILAFTINHQGKIENIHINKSSGFEVLDNAAIKALRKVTTNKDLASTLDDDTIEHTLPIIYKFNED